MRLQHLSEFQKLLFKSALALTVGIPLFVISMLDLTAVTSGVDQTVWIIVGLIVGAIMWYSGGHFFSGAWLSFKSHSANMNTLIALATGPAWLYSFIVSIWPSAVPELARHVYYDAPMTVIGLLVLGAALEMRAGEKSMRTAKKLEQLQVDKIRVLKDGKTVVVKAKF